jgi:hypothetical protein
VGEGPTEEQVENKEFAEAMPLNSNMANPAKRYFRNSFMNPPRDLRKQVTSASQLHDDTRSSSDCQALLLPAQQAVMPFCHQAFTGKTVDPAQASFSQPRVLPLWMLPWRM